MSSYIDKFYEFFKEAMNLEKKESLIITAPRRSGKTTFLRNLIASYNMILPERDILVVAPQKNFADNLHIKRVYSTSNSIRGLVPKVILVEEAAYCKDEVLETLVSIQEGEDNYIKTIYVSSPKKVNYKYNKESKKWEADNFLRRLIDSNFCKYYQLTFEDCPEVYKSEILKEKDYYTKDQWATEFGCFWVRNYIK